MKQTRNIKEDVVEDGSFVKNVVESLISEIIEDLRETEVDSCQENIHESNDYIAKPILMAENHFKSDQSAIEDRNQEQNSPIPWKEYKKTRKITTTSLLLKRRKNQRQRKQKPKCFVHETLRLRGGNGDENDDDPRNPDEDEGDGVNSKPDQASNTDGEEGRIFQPSSSPQIASQVDESQRRKRGREADDSFDTYVPVKQLNRPPGWSTWEDKKRQRPGPLQPPRVPTLDYANMTVTAIEDEDGVRIMSQYKDRYMRSELQLERISDAQRDQRKIGGGIYRCLERDHEGFELAIRKGFKSKTLGIVLRRWKQGKLFSIFESFGDMKYEYFKFSENGLRVRQARPEETPTGFIWTGVGGEMALPDKPSSNVFVFCERMDRDMHFSQVIVTGKGTKMKDFYLFFAFSVKFIFTD